MPITEAYDVKIGGIGRIDYSIGIERSTAAFYTPRLRQQIYTIIYRGAIPPPGPYPWTYGFLIPLPQDDGTWGWEASSIAMHFMELMLSIHSKYLVRTGIIRWASLADYWDDIIAERLIPMNGYGEARIDLQNGIATQPGSVYAIAAGFYSPNPTEYVVMEASGLMTELTRAWMI